MAADWKNNYVKMHLVGTQFLMNELSSLVNFFINKVISWIRLMMKNISEFIILSLMTEHKSQTIILPVSKLTGLFMASSCLLFPEKTMWEQSSPRVFIAAGTISNLKRS